MAHVVIRNAVKAYPPSLHGSTPTPVLADLSMEVGDGEFVALFGPNACGKTTLLDAIAGLSPLDAGSIAIDGHGPGAAKVGYILQNYRETLLPWATVRDNIAYPLRLQGVPAVKREKRVAQLLADLSIELPLDSHPARLSGGQQQLMAIARALVDEPDLMLLDEPFNALDIETRVTMHQKLEDIWRRTRATVVFVSHDIDEALLLADRVIILSKRPAHPLDTLAQTLPRPRPHALLEDERFFALRRRALRALREAMTP